MSDTEFGWMPIDTAPHDGTYILLAGPSGYMGTPLRVEVCKYDAEFRPKQPWVNHGGDSFTDGGVAPTLWMPLPANPTGEKEFPGQLLGGRGRCKFCGEMVGNVAYHQAHDCPKNTGVKELICSRCGNGIDDSSHIRYSPDIGKLDKHWFDPVDKKTSGVKEPEELPCPILETMKIEGHTSIYDLLKKLAEHASACAYGCPNRRVKKDDHLEQLATDVKNEAYMKYRLTLEQALGLRDFICKWKGDNWKGERRP